MCGARVCLPCACVGVCERARARTDTRSVVHTRTRARPVRPPPLQGLEFEVAAPKLHVEGRAKRYFAYGDNYRHVCVCECVCVCVCVHARAHVLMCSCAMRKALAAVKVHRVSIWLGARRRGQRCLCKTHAHHPSTLSSHQTTHIALRRRRRPPPLSMRSVKRKGIPEATAPFKPKK